MTHKVLLLIFPLIIFLTTPGCSDKPWLCLPGVRSKPCTRHCQVKQKRPVAGDKTNPEIQTSESSPGNWKCSRLWDPGVNKGRTVLPAWGRQFWTVTLERWGVQWVRRAQAVDQIGRAHV